MASALGLQLQATFAFGACQRRSRVGLWPAPASNDPLEKACVLRLTPRLSRGRVRSSWASGPPEGPSVEKKAITVIRKPAAGLQALAVAAACAVGASLCLSRRAAAMPDPRVAVTAPAPIAREGSAGITKILLRDIMFGKEPCDSACQKLLGHAFALLPLDSQCRLLEQFISQGKKTDANVGPQEIYEMQIAITQIYMAMHVYREANEVLNSMDVIKKDNEDESTSDGRIPLLKAVLNMMFALEKMLMEPIPEEPEVTDLIQESKKSWRVYKRCVSMNQPPSVTE